MERADILVITSPIWLGKKSSVCTRVIERLFANSHILNADGQCWLRRVMDGEQAERQNPAPRSRGAGLGDVGLEPIGLIDITGISSAVDTFTMGLGP